MKELDLSKPFFKTYREGDLIITEINSSNDSIGDFAFEWDIDGSQRKHWEEYIKDLEEKGIRGELTYRKLIMSYDPALDKTDFDKEYPLSQYKMIILDYGE
jgi:hypothetical protein